MVLDAAADVFFLMCLLCFEELSLIFQNFLLVLLAETYIITVPSGLCRVGSSSRKGRRYENTCC